MRDLEVSKELIEEVMKDKGTFETININKNELSTFGVLGHHIFSINIYEFAFKNLKQWAKLKNVFDKIDWSEEPEQIFKKAEKLKNEIN